MKVRVLVTGHTGFIGRTFTRALDDAGVSWIGASLSTGFNLENVDSLDELPDVDWVVHLAGIAGVRRSWNEPALFHSVNIGTALTALEATRKRKARFLYVSSYMYGIPEYVPVDERHALAWNNPYSASKRMVEMLCQTYKDNFGMPIVILRPFNLFGPQQSTEFLVPYVVHQALNSDTITVDDLAPRRDYLWVGDMARALQAVVTHHNAPNGVYNVGSGHSVSVGDVVDAVVKVCGNRKVVCREDARQNEIPDCVCDNRLFSQAFGWQPTVSVPEGIRMLAASFAGAPVRATISTDV